MSGINPQWASNFVGSNIIGNILKFVSPSLSYSYTTPTYHRNNTNYNIRAIRYLFATLGKADELNFDSWLPLVQDTPVYVNNFNVWGSHEIGFRLTPTRSQTQFDLISTNNGVQTNDFGSYSSPTYFGIQASMGSKSTHYITGSMTYNGVNYFIILAGYKSSNNVVGGVIGFCPDDIAQFGAFVMTNPTSPIFGEASKEQGYTGGTFDDSSDTISIPTKPTIGFTQTGVGNLYKIGQNTLRSFIAELFPSLPDDVGHYENPLEYLEDVAKTFSYIKQVFTNSKLVDYVLDCYALPVSAETGATEQIAVAYKRFTATAQVVSNDYVDVDCGSLNIGEYYANFLDYYGTRAKLYLPFIGYVGIEPEYFQSGTLQVKYRFNVVDGTCMAWVLSTSSKSKLTASVIGQYSGACSIHIPITGLSYSNVISGLANTAISVASNPSASGVVDGVINASQLRPSIESSNNYNANSTFLGIRRPYLIIERPVSSFSQSYNNEYGLPLNVTKKLADVSGFTICGNIHIDGIANATTGELLEIENLLKTGVVL